MRGGLNPFTGRPSEAHGGGPPDEIEPEECQEEGCNGVMLPQIRPSLVSVGNPQWYWCDECGARERNNATYE